MRGTRNNSNQLPERNKIKIEKKQHFTEKRINFTVNTHDIDRMASILFLILEKKSNASLQLERVI